MTRRSMQIRALLSLGILVGLSSVSTLAAWTGTATATSNITSGTVALGAGATAGTASKATYPVPIPTTNWYPGTTAAATVVVMNTGSLPAQYSIKGSINEDSDGVLGQNLVVSVKTGSAVSSTACSGEKEILSKAAGTIFSGEAIRPKLEPGAYESICVQYSLPATAASSLQGETTTINLVFTSSVGS